MALLRYAIGRLTVELERAGDQQGRSTGQNRHLSVRFESHGVAWQGLIGICGPFKGKKCLAEIIYDLKMFIVFCYKVAFHFK